MNEHFIDFFINLLASIFFVLIGFLLNYLLKWYKSKPLRGLWQPIFKNQKSLPVILSRKKGGLPWSSPMASFYEVQAYTELSIMSSNFDIKTRLVNGDNNEVLKSENLVLLGSPVSNDITKKIWDSIEHMNPFSFIMNNPIINIPKGEKTLQKEMNEYFFKFKEIEYKPKLDGNKAIEQSKWIEDYGLIMRMRNPINYEKHIMLAMGCHGISTFGAMSVLLNKNLAKKIKQKAGSKDFIALIHFKIVNNEIVFLEDYPRIIHWHIIVYD